MQLIAVSARSHIVLLVFIPQQACLHLFALHLCIILQYSLVTPKLLELSTRSHLKVAAGGRDGGDDGGFGFAAERVLKDTS